MKPRCCSFHGRLLYTLVLTPHPHLTVVFIYILASPRSFCNMPAPQTAKHTSPIPPSGMSIFRTPKIPPPGQHNFVRGNFHCDLRRFYQPHLHSYSSFTRVTQVTRYIPTLQTILAGPNCLHQVFRILNTSLVCRKNRMRRKWIRMW